MTDDEWSHAHARCLGVYLSGSSITETDERGRSLRDDNFLLLVNAHHDPVPFVLPAPGGERHWIVELDTYSPESFSGAAQLDTQTRYHLNARTLAVLRCPAR